jgi:hypothetical protein
MKEICLDLKRNVEIACDHIKQEEDLFEKHTPNKIPEFYDIFSPEIMRVNNLEQILRAIAEDLGEVEELSQEAMFTYNEYITRGFEVDLYPLLPQYWQMIGDNNNILPVALEEPKDLVSSGEASGLFSYFCGIFSF